MYCYHPCKRYCQLHDYKKWAKTQGIFCSGGKKGHKKHIGTEGHKYLITCVGF